MPLPNQTVSQPTRQRILSIAFPHLSTDRISPGAMGQVLDHRRDFGRAS